MCSDEAKRRSRWCGGSTRCRASHGANDYRGGSSMSAVRPPPICIRPQRAAQRAAARMVVGVLEMQVRCGAARACDEPARLIWHSPTIRAPVRNAVACIVRASGASASARRTCTSAANRRVMVTRSLNTFASNMRQTAKRGLIDTGRSASIERTVPRSLMSSCSVLSVKSIA